MGGFNAAGLAGVVGGAAFGAGLRCSGGPDLEGVIGEMTLPVPVLATDFGVSQAETRREIDNSVMIFFIGFPFST